MKTSSLGLEVFLTRRSSSPTNPNQAKTQTNLNLNLNQLTQTVKPEPTHLNLNQPPSQNRQAQKKGSPKKRTSHGFLIRCSLWLGNKGTACPASQEEQTKYPNPKKWKTPPTLPIWQSGSNQTSIFFFTPQWLYIYIYLFLLAWMNKRSCCSFNCLIFGCSLKVPTCLSSFKKSQLPAE